MGSPIEIQVNLFMYFHSTSPLYPTLSHCHQSVAALAILSVVLDKVMMPQVCK
jgi:hypothetical protein